MEKTNNTGYSIIIPFKLIDNDYFNVAESEYTFLQEGSIEYKLRTGERIDSTPIKDSQKLNISIGRFDNELLDSKAKDFITNFRLYLVKKRIAAIVYTYTIKNHAELNLKLEIDFSAQLSKLTLFDYSSSLKKSNEKTEKIIKLLEMALKVRETSLEILLYVATLDTLSNDDEVKSVDIIQKIDSLSDHINTLNWENKVDKDSLNSYLNIYKKLGSKKSIMKLLEDYGMIDKEYKTLNQVEKCSNIINKMFEFRSKFVHDGEQDLYNEHDVIALSDIVYEAVNKYIESLSK